MRLSFIGLDCSQQRAELAWLDDCGAMLDLGGDERAMQIYRHIPLCTAVAIAYRSTLPQVLRSLRADS